MRSRTWEEVKQRCAEIEATRLEPAAVFALLGHLPSLDPPSQEDGVARDGVSWEPLTADEHKKRVEANRASHSSA